MVRCTHMCIMYYMPMGAEHQSRCLGRARFYYFDVIASTFWDVPVPMAKLIASRLCEPEDPMHNNPREAQSATKKSDCLPPGAFTLVLTLPVLQLALMGTVPWTPASPTESAAPVRPSACLQTHTAKCMCFRHCEHV